MVNSLIVIKMVRIVFWLKTFYPTLKIKPFHMFILLSSLQFSAFIDAAVQKPYILTPEKLSECGESLTLTCIFKRDVFAIEWMDDNNLTPIAVCIRNNCDVDPLLSGEYSISVDLQQCVFNLTVINVTMSDNNRKLVCSDGSKIDSKIIRVREYEPVIFEDSNSGVMKAASGCIRYEKEVTFKWMKQTGSKLEEEAKFNPKISNNYTTGCPICGDDGRKRYTEIIFAKPSENGYHVKVIASYGNKSEESTYSVDKYIIEEQDEENTNNYILTTVVVAAVLTIILVISVAYFYIRSPKLSVFAATKNEKEKKRKRKTKKNKTRRATHGNVKTSNVRDGL